MTRDAIAITCAAFVFALTFALPVLVRGWRWLGRRAGVSVIANGGIANDEGN